MLKDKNPKFFRIKSNKSSTSIDYTDTVFEADTEAASSDVTTVSDINTEKTADIVNPAANNSSKSHRTKKSEKIKIQENKKSAYEIIKKESGKAAQSFMTAIDGALDDAEVVSESDIEQVIPESSKKKINVKRKLYFLISLVFSILAIIGLISSIIFISNSIKNIANNTNQKQELAEYIYPVVITDPAVFDDNKHIANDVLISAGIWNIILNEDTSKYPMEFDNITVPEADVELSATKLFGTGLSFEHRTIGDPTLSFYYNPDEKSYIVPLEPKVVLYYPVIEEIKKVGNDFHLKVGYQLPNTHWFVCNDEELIPGKYMEYVITKNTNYYTITSVKQLNISGIEGPYSK